MTEEEASKKIIEIKKEYAYNNNDIANAIGISPVTVRERVRKSTFSEKDFIKLQEKMPLKISDEEKLKKIKKILNL